MCSILNICLHLVLFLLKLYKGNQFLQFTFIKRKKLFVLIDCIKICLELLSWLVSMVFWNFNFCICFLFVFGTFQHVLSQHSLIRIFIYKQQLQSKHSNKNRPLINSQKILVRRLVGIYRCTKKEIFFAKDRIFQCSTSQMKYFMFFYSECVFIMQLSVYDLTLIVKIFSNTFLIFLGRHRASRLLISVNCLICLIFTSKGSYTMQLGSRIFFQQFWYIFSKF
eukprot:TRINITY_DN4354_c1_g1_i1.p1 TRINITY_DN4354_c1_g1~~TRINITY_DN4354_c1_g1_i1.p1  ORF type:complete len:223 (+),score=-21.13 TRINITY_DN4354_c1_g1_i1:224-892(+)